MQTAIFGYLELLLLLCERGHEGRGMSGRVVECG
jgi:hypothetical protein